MVSFRVPAGVSATDTAALFRWGLEAGGTMGGLETAHIQALAEAGVALGTAFQLVDDVLDTVLAGLDHARSLGFKRDLRRELAQQFAVRALFLVDVLPGGCGGSRCDFRCRAALGVLLFDAVDYLQQYPERVIWPGLAISLTVLSVNYIGDGLRDALDPRLRAR